MFFRINFETDLLGVKLEKTLFHLSKEVWKLFIQLGPIPPPDKIAARGLL